VSLNIPLLPSDVTLIAVSKKQSDAKIDQALAQGLRHFGENQIQEAIKHWKDRRQNYSDLTLHLIGPLQSNKTKEAVALFDVIHTIDRPKIAALLHQEMVKQQKHLPCFIQVNIGDEPQKSGIAISELNAFHAYCTQEIGLTIIGLMAIPPANEEATPYFQKLKFLADDLNLSELSMGMSDDYQHAIECGATHIRLGSMLFGDR
jgi:PLP dependent protein